ncbi:MAG: hypothetical protein JWN52_1794 [Actinomycetia bacterium]|nr:hypothetical protein [Actinomycetes bacterium]
MLALFQILLRLADAAITTHLDHGGDQIALEQISIKNARGALRRTIGQATAHMAEAMAAFTEDVLSTLTPRRPADRKRKACRGDKIKTFRVTYSIVPHPLAPRIAQPRVT